MGKVNFDQEANDYIVSFRVMAGLRSYRGILMLAGVFVCFFLILQGEFRYVILDMGDRCMFTWDSCFTVPGRVGGGAVMTWVNGFIVQFFHVPILGPAVASLVLALLFYFICSIAVLLWPGNKSVAACLSPLWLIPSVLLCINAVCVSFSFKAVTDAFVISAVVLILSGLGPVRRLFKRSGPEKKLTAGTAAVLFVSSLAVSIGVCLSVAGGKRQPRQEQLAQVSFYARREQWKYVLAVCRHMDMGNYMLLNYANLALSHEGLLLSNFTDFRQDSPQALCVASDMSAGSMMVRAMIYYHVGDVAAAQDMAFEANQFESNPYMMMMLVRTNVIFGSYGVARRYLHPLERTLYYRGWAEDMEKCIDRIENGVPDTASPLDMEILRKRAGLPQTDAFVTRDRMIEDLMLLLEKDSANVPARDYAIVSLILSRDSRALKQFVDKFYGTEVLPMLSLDMQIGLLSATDGDEDYCRSHGVGDKAIMMYKNERGN